MSDYGEAEDAISEVAATLAHTVDGAEETLSNITDLSDAFQDIDTAFNDVMKVLDNFNRRLAKLEARTAEMEGQS